MKEFYIGQIFEGDYPIEVADWCNESGTCHIAEIEPIEKEVEIEMQGEEGNTTTKKELQTVRRFQIVETPQPTEEEKRQRLNMLSLTKREVFLALFKAKGITPEQLKSQITDTEALIEFEYANEYYRGNPLIDLIGAKLGYTSDDLDYLFQNKILPAKE